MSNQFIRLFKIGLFVLCHSIFDHLRVITGSVIDKRRGTHRSSGSHSFNMQFFTVVVALFATSLMAAPTSSAIKPAATAKAAVVRKLSPANPPTAKDVNNSVTNWMQSVNTVNDYLNNPNDTQKLRSAILFSKDEPVQLATLMKTPALSKMGVNAGKVLMGNFGSIVSNLNMVNAGQMSSQDATMAVNFNRCCTVLPNIAMLWSASMNATKQVMTMPPNLEDTCATMVCNDGVSVGATGSNGTKTAASSSDVSGGMATGLMSAGSIAEGTTT